ncbi:MAG: hypothetical protein WKF37_04845 [Bryobacteraceae bacterium]
MIRLSWNIAAGASPTGTLECVGAWLTRFRQDLAAIDVPTWQFTARRTHPAARGYWKS